MSVWFVFWFVFRIDCTFFVFFGKSGFTEIFAFLTNGAKNEPKSRTWGMGFKKIPDF